MSISDNLSIELAELAEFNMYHPKRGALITPVSLPDTPESAKEVSCGYHPSKTTYASDGGL